MKRFALPLVLMALIIVSYFFWSRPQVSPNLQLPKQENKITPIKVDVTHSEESKFNDHDFRQAPLELVNIEKTNTITFENSDVWEDELFDILRQVDLETADDTFKNYQLEMESFKRDQEIVLAEGINSLRTMSGESLGTERTSGINLNARERQHQEKIKHILGDNYEFILERYHLFQDTTAPNK